MTDTTIEIPATSPCDEDPCVTMRALRDESDRRQREDEVIRAELSEIKATLARLASPGVVVAQSGWVGLVATVLPWLVWALMRVAMPEQTTHLPPPSMATATTEGR